MPNSSPNTSGLNPQAARKGRLKQGTIQLTVDEWAFLDRWVEQAKAARVIHGRIGRADVIRGLLVALSHKEKGLRIDLRKYAIGKTPKQ